MDLTPRQLEILRYVSHGYSNAEIGRATNTSEDTIKTHMRRILGALQAIDRAHAVRIGFEEGFLFPVEHRRPRPNGTSARVLRFGDRRIIDGRLVAVKAPAHGKYTTYSNWGCRCEPCTVANREKKRDYEAVSR